MILKFVIIFSLANILYCDSGVAVNCGQSTCDSCYSGIWEEFDGSCRVSDCDEPVEQLSEYWCQSCKPNSPYPNYQRNECVKSDCKQIQLKDVWCSDCSDFSNKIADLEKKVCTFDCRSPPAKGKYSIEWCEVCERPSVYLTKDRSACKQSDCQKKPEKGKYTNQFCLDCSPKKPFANYKRDGCQLTQVNRNIFSIKIDFNLFALLALMCIMI